MLVAVAGATWPLFPRLPQGETRIYLAVLAAVPLLAVRTVYSILADFENNATFAILNGSPYAQLGMAVVEEMIVTIIFIGVGVFAPRMGLGQMAAKPATGSAYA